MANDKTIYQLPDLEEVTGDEEFPVSYNRKNYNVNISQVKDYVAGNTITNEQIDTLFPNGDA